MSAVLLATGVGTEQKEREGEKRPGFTFQDVNTLLVGRVGVGVVWRREHAAVDVADPRAAVVLVGALCAMFAQGF